MAWQWSSVRTKVAQRLVVLFAICALAPLCAFALLASWMVTNATREQLLTRLHVDAKSVGMSTVERLGRAESRLRLLAEIIAVEPPGQQPHAMRAAESFEAAWLVDRDGRAVALKGSGLPPGVSLAQQARLLKGETVIATRAPAGRDGLLLDMAVPAGSSYLVASMDALALWDLTDDSMRPTGEDACVLDEHQRTLACSDERAMGIDHVRARLNAGSGVLTWQADGHEMLGAFWSAPLAGQFHIQSWTFVVAQPAAAATATTVTFQRAFAAVVVATLSLMVGVSLTQIRRHLEPLERLQAAATCIRAGDFGARAHVSSGDEFQALADSFNLMADEVQRRFAELRALSLGTLEALARAIDAKSPWTLGHSQRVTWVGVRLATEMGLPADEIERLRYGGLLHDIGKLGVPGRILEKPGRLTLEEAKVIRLHPGLGARILEPIAAYAPMIPVVLEHHERYDGSGYPRRLVGEEISLGGRIFAVADVVDAMLSDRPYRRGIPFERVVRYIGEQSGRAFDPTVVEAFQRIVSDVQTHYEKKTNEPALLTETVDEPRKSRAS